jgi:hypothetical protein
LLDTLTKRTIVVRSNRSCRQLVFAGILGALTYRPLHPHTLAYWASGFLPAVYYERNFVASGGLISYGQKIETAERVERRCKLAC